MVGVGCGGGGGEEDVWIGRGNAWKGGKGGQFAEKSQFLGASAEVSPPAFFCLRPSMSRAQGIILTEIS